MNINPAYRINELEYALKKVGCKGLITNDVFKTQKYMDMILKICPELDSCKSGELNSKRLPDLKSLIIIDDNSYKYKKLKLFYLNQLKLIKFMI